MSNEIKEEPLSKLERDRLDKIKSLIDDILQTREYEEDRTAYVKEIFVPPERSDTLGLTYFVTITDPKEVMIHVLQIDMLREEVKQKLGITLSSICPVDRHTIELIYNDREG
jgi:hypothetical protein